MKSVVLVVPGDLDTRTGGYEYDRRVADGLRARGWTITVLRLDASFPYPTAAARADADAVFGSIPDNSTVLVDGLALGVLPREAERHAKRLRLAAIVHHPLARETGIEPSIAAELETSERAALATVRRVVVTGLATASLVGTYGVPADHVSVVQPGTDRAAVARGSGESSPNLLCVATLIPRKGHEILLRALASLEDRNWRLTCVGSADRDPVTSARLRVLTRDLGLEELVSFAGEASGAVLDSHYDRADLFVLPTLYEGYGMAVAEALARALPVVSTTTGSIPDIVVDGSGVLVPPGDINALSHALARLLSDANARERVAAQARRVRDRLPTWADAAMKMAGVLERIADE